MHGRMGLCNGDALKCARTGPRVTKQLRAEVKDGIPEDTASLSKGIAGLVFDVCGVLQRFDQVAFQGTSMFPLAAGQHCHVAPLQLLLEWMSRLQMIPQVW